jgi:cysteinyl-tRNA synthetase
MSEALLGLPFDIHTGGIDHREIHHPNEIAQNQAHSGCDHSGAQIWMHNNFLIDRGGKMSKSAGEFLTLQALVDRGFHPLAYRLMCLQAHYRSELEFSWENLGAALTRLKRLVIAIELIAANAEPAHEISDPKLLALLTEFEAAISEDLNTAVGLTILESVISLKKPDQAQKLATISGMDSALGLNLLSAGRATLRITPKTAAISEADIETALNLRKGARANKDFATSDRIRDDLLAKGVEVMDGDPLGWDWKLAV